MVKVYHTSSFIKDHGKLHDLLICRILWVLVCLSSFWLLHAILIFYVKIYFIIFFYHIIIFFFRFLLKVFFLLLQIFKLLQVQHFSIIHIFSILLSLLSILLPQELPFLIILVFYQSIPII